MQVFMQRSTQSWLVFVFLGAININTHEAVALNVATPKECRSPDNANIVAVFEEAHAIYISCDDSLFCLKLEKCKPTSISFAKGCTDCPMLSGGDRNPFQRIAFWGIRREWGPKALLHEYGHIAGHNLSYGSAEINDKQFNFPVVLGKLLNASYWDMTTIAPFRFRTSNARLTRNRSAQDLPLALALQSFSGKAQSRSAQAGAPQPMPPALRCGLRVDQNPFPSDARRVLQQNLQIAQNFKPFSEAEMQELRDRCKPDAADGRYELYKLSLKFDNPEARFAHNFPLDTEQSEVEDMLGAQQNTGHPFPEKQF
jgi:hypothetical protein